MGNTKLCLNGTTLGNAVYNGGYGDGLFTSYINKDNISSVPADSILTKTFTLSDSTSDADCITAQLNGAVTKIEIISIKLTAKS